MLVAGLTGDERAGRAALRREALIAAAAAELRGPTGAPLAPPVLGVDEESMRTELLVGHVSMHELMEQSEPHEDVRAAQFGATLAALHDATYGPALPEAPTAIPYTCTSPNDLAALPEVALELIARRQAVEGWDAALEELATTAPSETFVHGDAKLDNALWGTQGDVRLIDWELGGRGDWRWDVGSAAGDYLARWIASARIERGSPMSLWLARARVSRRHAATGARAVMRGYELVRGPRTDRSGIARYVGIFLLHRAQALSEHAGRVGARATLLATVGERLVVAPELLATLLAADDA